MTCCGYLSGIIYLTSERINLDARFLLSVHNSLQDSVQCRMHFAVIMHKPSTASLNTMCRVKRAGERAPLYFVEPYNLTHVSQAMHSYKVPHRLCRMAYEEQAFCQLFSGHLGHPSLNSRRLTAPGQAKTLKFPLFSGACPQLFLTVCQKVQNLKVAQPCQESQVKLQLVRYFYQGISETWTLVG